MLWYDWSEAGIYFQYKPVKSHMNLGRGGGQKFRGFCGQEANHENFTHEISKSVLYCD